ncbi:hypothetical protein KYJ98_10610 [Mammaliicoccus lentus]|uniref:hypothetical protein n=1 Tax=Mammaliicoccus lentus TaxID=42858 RepID=UPI001C4E07D6|nr:hypothetical protein [Mammaliicoccus lentus]MBW0770771.1 hypothetical protein [Mammaliicoccus lentus]
MKVVIEMYAFDKNFIVFIEYYKVHKSIPSITQVAKSLGLSRRVIYYYIQKSNDILTKYDRTLSSEFQNNQYQLNDEQILLIEEHINKNTLYVLSQKERILFIIAAVIFKTKKLQIKLLTEHLKVSKNTILSDLKSVKAYFAIYNLTLKNSKQYGYYIECTNCFRRNLLFEIIDITEKNEFYVLQENIFEFNIDDFDITTLDEKINTFIDALNMSETLLNKKIAYQNKLILGKSFFIMKYFKHELSMEYNLNIVKKRIEYKVAQHIYEILNPKIKIEHQEVIYLAIQLLCIDKDEDHYYKSHTFTHLFELSELFIETFESISSICIKNREKFIELIQTQFKVFFFRQQFNYANQYIQNEITDKELQLLIRITECVFNHIYPTQVYKAQFKRQFHHRDIYDCAIAIQALYNEEMLEKQVNNIIVVTSLPQSESKIFLLKLKRFLKTPYLLKHMPIEEAINYINHADYCITTAQRYNHPNAQTIHVSKFLTNKDIHQLSILNQNKLSSLDYNRHVLKILDYDGLTNKEKAKKIHEIYNQLNDNEEVMAITLQEACPKHFKYVFTEGEKFIDIINKMKENIITSGYASRSILEQLVLNEDNKNNYSFIYPGVLLMYTNQHFANSKCSVSIAKIDYPCYIKIANESRVVKNVILLTLDNTVKHLSVLLEIDDLCKTGKLNKYILDNL